MKSSWLKYACWYSLAIAPLFAQNGGRYVQTNLVSDVPGKALHTDSNLVNGWGIAFGGSGPWWVNAAATSQSLVYDGNGNPFPLGNPLRVTIPPKGESEPTGIVFNESAEFQVGPGARAIFLFASSDGTISGWNPNVNPTTAIVKVMKSGASYKGLTLGHAGGRNVLYAANFAASGSIDMFDGSFAPIGAPAGAFQDPMLPRGYAPFNVQNIGGAIFVAFAKVGPTGDEEAGPGLGFVDKFSPEGRLELRLEKGSWFNAPWGMVASPEEFGAMGDAILVGQFGSGQIGVFHPQNGKFKGLIRGRNKEPIQIEGLWGIRFGNGGNAGSRRELFFAAGINDEAHGLFGKLAAIDDAEDDKEDRL